MGFTEHFNLHFRVNSLFHHLCHICSSLGLDMVETGHNLLITVAHIWKQNEQFLKQHIIFEHNSIFVKQKKLPKHNTKLSNTTQNYRTQHKIIETTENHLNTTQNLILCRVSMIFCSIISKQHKIIETQHINNRNNTKYWRTARVSR